MHFGCLSKSSKEGQTPQVSCYTDTACEDDSLLFFHCGCVAVILLAPR